MHHQRVVAKRLQPATVKAIWPLMGMCKVGCSSKVNASVVATYVNARPVTFLGACRINPTGDMYFDGTTLGPYDVLFVKLKRLMLEGRTPGTTNALRYGNWMSASVCT